MRGDVPKGWNALLEEEFQKATKPTGWTSADEDAFNAQFGPSVGQYALQTAESIGQGVLTAAADVTGLGGQALRQVGVDPKYLPQEMLSQGLRAGAEAIPNVTAVQASPEGPAKFLTTTGANVVGQALPAMAGAAGLSIAGKAAGLTAQAATRLGTIGAGAIGSAQAATQGGREAAALGGTKAEQWGAFFLNGGLGALDSIVPGKILARLEDAAGPGLRQAALGMIGETGSGAWTNAVQQYGADLYAQGTFDPDRDIGAIEAAKEGGFASFFLSALATGAHLAKAGKLKARPLEHAATDPSATFTDQATEPGSEPMGAVSEAPGADLSNTDQAIDLTGQGGTFAEQAQDAQDPFAGVRKVIEPSGEAGGLATAPDAGSSPTFYHGTPKAFSGTFSQSAPKTTGGGLNRYGFSFGDQKTAERYSRDFSEKPGAVIPARLSFKKPLDMSAVDFEKLQSLVSKIDSGEQLSEFNDIDLEQMLPGWKPGQHPIEWIKENGYDALRKAAGRGGAEAEVIVFDPSQITRLDEQPGAAPTSTLTPGTEVRAESRSEQTPPALIESAQPKAEESGQKRDVVLESVGAEAEEPIKGKPPPKGRDATESVPHYGPDREATGVKNRTVDAELQSMGLDEAEHDGPLKDEDVRKRAVDTFNDDNLAGSRLADELAESDRTATADEIGLLTLETARRKAEHRKASEAFRADQTPATRAALDKAAAEYGTLADTVTKLGTRQAQAFRLRQMMMRADYSLAEMEHRLVEAKDGEPLTEAEHADLAVKAEKIADLQKRAEEEANASERERRIRALEDAVAQLEKGRQRREYVRGREARVQRSRARITELFGEFKRLSSRARTGLDADSLKVLGQIAAEHIKIGFNTFAKFAAEVKGKLDEAHHKAAWDEGLKVYRDELIAPMRERMKAGATLKELHRYVLKIADSYHRDGVTDREKLVDAVTGAVQAIDPKVTRDQIIVAIPDYGNYKPLSKEEHAVGLRKIKGELREIAKLKDLERGLAPKKTGPERGEPSDEQRRLAKQVREKMKALGIKTTNADTQIKSALESAKTRTRNAINDLTTAIDTRTQIKKGERVDVSDAELVELKAQRAELEKVYADLFVGPKDDPKIRTLVDSIADLDKRIAAGDTSTRGAKQGPEPRADIAALKAERAEKAKTLADMRKEAEAKTADERLADQVKRLTERRDKLKGKLFDAGQGGSVDPKGAKQGPDVARVAELKAEIASLNETIGDIRDARDPKLTDEQRATASAERRAQARLEREQARMRSGDFEPVKKEPVERFKSAKEIETLTELDLAKRIVDRGREAARRRNRTKLQVAIDAAKEVVDLPRAIKSSWDLSAPFRQGMFFTLGHPIKAGEFAYQMIRAAKSPEYAERISQQLKHRHLGAFAERSRLELTGDTFTKQEEAIRSALSDKIPGIKRSNAAYQTFLNLQRAWMFDTMVQGLPNAPTIEQGREIARIVNIATGRGDVGKFAATVKGASYVLWAPRLLVSRFQLLAEPARQAIKAGTGTGDAGTRKAIAKEYARTLAGLGAVYAAAQFAGLWMDDEDKPTVSLDVTSSDFGKIRIGNTRIDPLAGLAQITVLLGRHEDMAETVAAGGTPKQGSDSTLGRFLRYKLAPDIAVPIEILSGKNAVGEKRTPLQTIGESVTPLAISDVYETMQEQGVAKGTAISILAIFGMGVQTYEDKKRSPAHTKAR